MRYSQPNLNLILSVVSVECYLIKHILSLRCLQEFLRPAFFTFADLLEHKVNLKYQMKVTGKYFGSIAVKGLKGCRSDNIEIGDSLNKKGCLPLC